MEGLSPEKRQEFGSHVSQGKTEDSEGRRKKHREETFAKKSREEIEDIYKRMVKTSQETYLQEPERKEKKREANKRFYINHPERIEELSIKNRGYSNFDFVARWKPLYDLYKDKILELVLFSNLGDNDIEKILKLPFMLITALDYYNFLGEIKNKRNFFYKDLSTLTKIKKKKTIYDTNKYSYKEYVSYRFINSYRLNHFEANISYALNFNYSDSYVNNFLKKSSYLRDLEYYEYLDLISIEKVSIINIRSVFPNAQRATGKKTFIRLNSNFEQKYKLLGEDLNEYRLQFNEDGRSVSISRI